jgi:hypothetical protein
LRAEGENFHFFKRTPTRTPFLQAHHDSYNILFGPKEFYSIVPIFLLSLFKASAVRTWGRVKAITVRCLCDIPTCSCKHCPAASCILEQKVTSESRPILDSLHYCRDKRFALVHIGHRSRSAVGGIAYLVEAPLEARKLRVPLPKTSLNFSIRLIFPDRLCGLTASVV